MPTVQQQDWDRANEYFRLNPLQTIYRKKAHGKFAFIKAKNGKIYAKDVFLGAGSFGKVKTLVDPAGKTFAIKTIKCPNAQHEGYALKEDQNLRDVGMFEFSVDYHSLKVGQVRKHAIAMEYIGGTDLQARIEGKKLTQIERLKIALGAATDLEKLHAKNIIHRDIKPLNIKAARIVGTDFKVKLVDFGLAMKLLKHQTKITLPSADGTPGYMAPEITNSGIYSKESDIFALGMTFIELGLHDLHTLQMINVDPKKRTTLAAVKQNLTQQIQAIEATDLAAAQAKAQAKAQAEALVKAEEQAQAQAAAQVQVQAAEPDLLIGWGRLKKLGLKAQAAKEPEAPAPALAPAAPPANPEQEEDLLAGWGALARMRRAKK